MRSYLVVLLLVTGCASQSPIKTAWTPTNEQWESVRKTGTNLNRPNGARLFLPAQIVNNLLTAKERIEARAGFTADLAIVETDSPNAFAKIHNGRPLVAFSTSYLHHLGRDRDAVATTMGHELAHLKLGHSGEAQKAREEAAQGISAAVGTAVGLFVPFGATLTNVAVTSYYRSFTRDEERAADDLGLRWAVDAGYDPCGKARTVEVFAKAYGASIPFLSTHPGYGERSELANEYAKREGRPACL